MMIHVWFCPNEDCTNHYGAPQPEFLQMLELLKAYDAPFTGSQCFCGAWMDADTCLREVAQDWRRDAPPVVLSDPVGAE